MNKKNLTDYVADMTSLTKRESNILIDAVLDGITQGLIEDRKVTLVGFGSFSAVDRPARTARNPKTGEPVSVPPKVVPKFKPSKLLKDVVAELSLSDVYE